MQRSKTTHVVILAAAIVAAAWIIAPHARQAIASPQSPSTYSLRLLAIPENGTAIVVDQSNRAWLVTPGALRAAPVLNEGNQHILIR